MPTKITYFAITITHALQIYKYKYREYICGVGTSGPVGKQATPTLVRANNALSKARMTPSKWIFKLFFLDLKFKKSESLDIAFQKYKTKRIGEY